VGTETPGGTPTPSAATESDSGGITISGTALGNDVTRKDHDLEWTPESLEKLAPTLADDSRSDDWPGDGLVVVDHENGDASAVGELTHSSYNQDTEEIEYEATLDANARGQSIANSVRNGELEVSPRLIHADPSVLPANEDGVRTVTGDAAKRGVHLSLVQSSAGASSTATAGPLDGPNPAKTDASTLRRVNIADTQRYRDTNTTTTDMTSNQTDTDSNRDEFADAISDFSAAGDATDEYHARRGERKQEREEARTDLGLADDDTEYDAADLGAMIAGDRPGDDDD
jgi:hypothetical protein